MNPRTSCHILLPGCFGVLLAVLAAIITPQAAYSQPNDIPNPNVYDTNGPVFAIVQSGNAIYIGGSFTLVGSSDGIHDIPRDNLAAIDAVTGQATDWDPLVDGTVYTLAVSEDGQTVFVGGDFTTVGGELRNRIAAIDTVTGLATDWNPEANSTIESLAVSGSTVYAGGSFTQIGGQARNFIAAIDAQSGLATNWDPNASSIIEALAVAGSTIYVGGSFTEIGGQLRNRIAAIDAVSGLATEWNPDANSNVFTIAVSHNQNTVYIGGFFNQIGGQTRNFITALDAETGLATEWNPNANSIIYALAVSSDDSIVYTGGFFNFIGGQARNFVAALDATTSLATNWNPSPSSAVWALATSDEAVYIGGWFDSIGGGLLAYFAYFGDLVNAAPDPPANLGPERYVDGSSGSKKSPQLEFTQFDPNVDDLLAYRIQIDDDGDFTSPVLDYTSDSIAQGAVGFTVNHELQPGSYYWRVRSSDGVNVSDWAVANGGEVAFVITQPSVDFSSMSYSGSENEAAITITVMLGNASEETVIVDYASSNGTATAIEDYTAVSGTLTFPPGQISQTFSIVLINDALDETDETIVLTLSNPTNASLANVNNPAIITISDNDTTDDGDGQDDDKVILCHIPPGNPDNAHTIEVNPSAVDAHLAHGDYLGACSDNDADDEDEGNEEEQEDKVMLCHTPPGKPDQAHIIAVSQSAVAAHLQYGDYLGECRDDSEGADNTNHGSPGGNQKHDDEDHDLDNGSDEKDSGDQSPFHVEKKAVVQEGRAELELKTEQMGAQVSLAVDADDGQEKINLSVKLSEGEHALTEGIPGVALPITLSVQADSAADQWDGTILVSIEISLSRLAANGMDEKNSGIYFRHHDQKWKPANHYGQGESEPPQNPTSARAGHYRNDEGKVIFWLTQALQRIKRHNSANAQRRSSQNDAAAWEYTVGQLASYTLSVQEDPAAGGKVSIEPSQETYSQDALVTLTASTEDRFEFVKWEGLNSSENPITFTIQNDLVVIALFQEKPLIEEDQEDIVDHDTKDDDIADEPGIDDDDDDELDDDPPEAAEENELDLPEDTDLSEIDDNPLLAEDTSLCGTLSGFSLMLMLFGLVGMQRSRSRN